MCKQVRKFTKIEKQIFKAVQKNKKERKIANTELSAALSAALGAAVPAAVPAAAPFVEASSSIDSAMEWLNISMFKFEFFFKLTF